MGLPYRARVNERWFLNLPGFHGGAYLVAYVEDTSECGPRRGPYCKDDCTCCPASFEPRISHSIWPLVCVIWLMAAAVVSCAIGALVLLFG